MKPRNQTPTFKSKKKKLGKISSKTLKAAAKGVINKGVIRVINQGKAVKQAPIKSQMPDRAADHQVVKVQAGGANPLRAGQAIKGRPLFAADQARLLLIF